jgi:hypothetical protein
MSTSAAVYTQGFKPQDVADVNRIFEGSNNRTEMIAARTRMVRSLHNGPKVELAVEKLIDFQMQRAAGIDSWEPSQLRKSAIPEVTRTVKWNAPTTIPVEGAALSARPDRMFNSHSMSTAQHSAVSSTINTAGQQASGFGRDGAFTRSFRTMNGEGCVPTKR